MKKLVLLVCVFMLLILRHRRGIRRPTRRRKQFTITGYHTPAYRLSKCCPNSGTTVFNAGRGGERYSIGLRLRRTSLTFKVCGNCQSTTRETFQELD